MATRVVKKGPAPIGLQIDALFKIREELRVHQEAEKLINERIKAAEEQIMATMEKDGTDKVTGKLATVSISSTVTGNVEDWDALYAYIYKNKFGHLLQRRLSDPAIRELFETKGAVPGVVPFTKKRLNVRKIS